MSEYIKAFVKWMVLATNELITFILPKYEKENTSILLLRLDNIGDFILWLGSAEKIKENYKESKIILICNSAFYDLAKELDYFDEVISLNIKNFNLNLKYKYNFLKSLRKEKFKKVISPICSRNIVTEGIIKNIFAKEIIGNYGDCNNISPFQRKICDRNYTKLIKTNPEHKMELYKNLDFINELFNKDYKLSLPILKIQKKERIIKGEYCIFFMGASNLKKCWEIEKYVEVAKTLKLKIVLCGGKIEEGLGGRFLDLINDKKNIVNLIGKTSLIDIVNLIKKSKFILSNDSFSIHLATLLRVKSICILGGGHFGRFLPYPKELENESNKFLPKVIYKEMECFNCNWKCRYNDIPWKCIKNIKTTNIQINKELDKWYI